jgi:hypothetical protein
MAHSLDEYILAYNHNVMIQISSIRYLSNETNKQVK